MPLQRPLAVAVEFDHAQEILRRGIFRGLQRPGRAEGNFEECPAVHARHVYAGRFNAVVELQRVILVRSS